MPIDPIAAEASEATPSLLDSAALGGELLALCERFSDDLFAWLERAIAAEPASHRVPLKQAVGALHYTMAERLLYPTLLHHAELVPPRLGAPRRK